MEDDSLLGVLNFSKGHGVSWTPPQLSPGAWAPRALFAILSEQRADVSSQLLLCLALLADARI